MAIPLLGRLSVTEWPLVFVSITLAWIEYVLSWILALLPNHVIHCFTWCLKVLYSFSADPIRIIGDGSADANAASKYRYVDVKGDSAFEADKYHLMIDMLNSPDFQTSCGLFGYDVESHIVKTGDNYLLTIHRVVRPKLHIPRNGKVVYLHHGLLMSSDIWVTMLERHLNLPFLLHDLGYDVWLGNNRGNKYLQKHLFYRTNSDKFWNFLLDEFALFDIPNTIDYILSNTGARQLTYIGFSQGLAQAFASISVNPELKDRIDRMIAISPATTPHGLYLKFLDLLLKASPSLVYLIFLRKVLMPSVLMWQKLMYPPFFDTMIDISNYLLFNWKLHNITKMQKLASYAHLYSTTSVKCVVHWFQVISLKRFQMFKDSELMSGLNPIYYPLKNIRVPIHIIYGDIDSLVDIEVMKSQLPLDTTTTQAVPNHEHLDNLWGHDVKEMVFKYVLEYLGETELTPSNVKTKQLYLQFDTDERLLSAGSVDGEETIRGEDTAALFKMDSSIKISRRRPSVGGTVLNL
jgi:lysosomal acid lipase/cholesteryl ester hydrolase